LLNDAISLKNPKKIEER
jgi:hypothetical protein